MQRRRIHDPDQEHPISTTITHTPDAPDLDRPEVSLRSPELRELGRRLAEEAAERVTLDGPLPVRRREIVRRSIRRVGRQLHWPLLATYENDAVDTAAAELRKVVKSGARSLERSADNEIEHKLGETDRIEEVLEALRELAETEDPEVFPQEFSYERTSRRSGGLQTVTDVLEIEDAEAAKRAAKKVARSLPRAGRLQRDMVAHMEHQRDAFTRVRLETRETVRQWRGILGEVLLVLRESH